jgi:hypothetical protein
VNSSTSLGEPYKWFYNIINVIRHCQLINQMNKLGKYGTSHVGTINKRNMVAMTACKNDNQIMIYDLRNMQLKNCLFNWVFPCSIPLNIKSKYI